MPSTNTGTITGTIITQTVTLGPGPVSTYPTYTSPLTVTSSGYVDNTGTGDAIYGPNTQAWTVANYGRVTAGRYGIDLSDGGFVSNNGTIKAGTAGVFVGGAIGTVSNSNSIFGYRTGVDLEAGGTVANRTGGTIAGDTYGVRVSGGAGSVTNTGYIGRRIQPEAYADIGVAIDSGGTIINQSSGTIVGFFTGVDLHDATCTLTNAGTVGGAIAAVFLNYGGVVVNSVGGLIAGRQPGVNVSLWMRHGPGYVTNAGNIGGAQPANVGVVLNLGGTVVNQASGTISGSAVGVLAGPQGTSSVSGSVTITNFGTISGGNYGVDVTGGAGTITDSGTIIGTSGTAVRFGGSGSNLVVLEHGYKITGSVVGSTSATNTIELAGSAGATVTAGFNSLGLTNFQDVLFGPGGYDMLKVSNTSGTLAVTISGFGTVSDIIDLTAIGTNGTIASQSGTLVTITGSLGSVTLQGDASDASNFKTSSDLGTGTDVMVACFRRGTLILTDRGEVAVEDLAIGDEVVTVSGAARPVKWIGHRAYDGRFIAGNRAVLPIRIEAGALAGGIPTRDLFVSPEHALYLDGVLAPAQLLVNGATITQVESVERLEYFHIELELHDVILAEGAPAESYVECDNRFSFQNGGEFAARYPGDRPEPWQFCAPRAEPGSAELTAIRAALLARAAALGRVTSDPDLHLVADGEIVRAHSVAGRVWRFALPQGARAVAIASRSAVPAEAETAAADQRALGVAVERIVLCGAGLRIEIGHECPALSEGFHADEGSHRWSNGRGSLPATLLAPFAGDVRVEVQLAETVLRYRTDPPAGEPPDATLPSEDVDRRAAV